MFNSAKSQLILYSVFISANCMAEVNQQPYISSQIVSESSVSTIFKNSIALTRSQLDQQRGGFIDKSGFKISIGFEKVVVVNGRLEAKARFYIPELNLAKPNNNNVKDLALTMNTLREKLNKKEYDGESTQAEQDAATGSINTVADTLKQPLPHTTEQHESTSLTTKQNLSDDDYTDALLSMLSSTQSSTSAPSTASSTSTSLPTTLTSVVMNTQDSSLIQSFQMLNIKIDNLGQYRSRSVNTLVLPQIINSLR